MKIIIPTHSDTQFSLSVRGRVRKTTKDNNKYKIYTTLSSLIIVIVFSTTTALVRVGSAYSYHLYHFIYFSYYIFTTPSVIFLVIFRNSHADETKLFFLTIFPLFSTGLRSNFLPRCFSSFLILSYLILLL